VQRISCLDVRSEKYRYLCPSLLQKHLDVVTSEQIDEIVRILVSECQPEKIILFGSYAQGTATEDSDLDLAIVKKTDLPHNKRSYEFRKALRADGRRWLFGMDILVFTPEEMEMYKNSLSVIVSEILQTGKTL